MRYEPTGRGHEIRLVLEATSCPACGNPFKPGPLYTTSWRNCWCTSGQNGPTTGHTVHCCLVETCRTHTLEPPCSDTAGATRGSR